ncbi:hypothetical protein SKAU_G00203120 [Synaphobranchus kaupii]|uniref:Uncharacterized protein n=1 Tax=Synaphobranchus kaupii TaxID=118154 RepID=A0A9Q1IYE6_SYNKA|nr:hypothetical protein SKAU_G00203120 [Synaphobranchus kaupii]
MTRQFLNASSTRPFEVLSASSAWLKSRNSSIQITLNLAGRASLAWSGAAPHSARLPVHSLNGGDNLFARLQKLVIGARRDRVGSSDPGPAETDNANAVPSVPGRDKGRLFPFLAERQIAGADRRGLCILALLLEFHPPGASAESF